MLSDICDILKILPRCFSISIMSYCLHEFPDQSTAMNFKDNEY